MSAARARRTGCSRTVPRSQADDKSKVHSPKELSKARLLALLASLQAQVAALSTQKPFHMEDTKRTLKALDEATRAHFEALEEVPYAALRHYFTRDETKWSLEKHIVEDAAKEHDLGWLILRCFEDDKARVEWLHRVPAMSLQRAKEVALPEAHAYDAKVHNLLREIITGEHKVHHQATEATDCCVIA